jgi:hypothetical protein
LYPSGENNDMILSPFNLSLSYKKKEAGENGKMVKGM